MDASDELRALLPKHKSDMEHAKAIVARGWPAVAPILPELMEWLQDCNWPVSNIIAPFLASIGMPVVDEVRRILHTNDDIWKYWVLSRVVAESPEVAAALRDNLNRLAFAPTANEVAEDVDATAREILASLKT